MRKANATSRERAEGRISDLGFWVLGFKNGVDGPKAILRVRGHRTKATTPVWRGCGGAIRQRSIDSVAGPERRAWRVTIDGRDTLRDLERASQIPRRGCTV